MEDHETRRKIIREWMALPKDKRHTEEQVAAFAKKGGPAKRVPSQSAQSEPEISARSVPEINGMAFASRWQVVIGRHSMTNSPERRISPATASVPRRPESGINPMSHPFGSTASLPLSMRRRSQGD